ncbi:TonB-dependent receptor [Alteromonas sp. 38]|uniref:TonB-dependent receptor n=1 Tax=unclassified Alteromonas TaxID=2614992 RepID=UPI0012F33240|nr:MULTISPECIES: TonB-dependent receptor [unclassified Alteromonas]CAD5276719.1 TonB-dependent receptor [Alteromonas sp. 154]VXB70312.1 TonB-dependent receptor [Alteromonas sp. 38]
MKNGIFKLGLIASSISSILSPSITLAQDADNAVNNDIEVISVSGIRGALARSQAEKMNASSIVESISAEDIGKLPDSSIAESLARLPGLAGERSGGRTSGISIRGFKEDFTGTSLNGRELIGIGDNRGVEYDLYPSEIMTGATIYKTTEADLMVQGIGGTVDLQTVRPLQASDTITINTSYELGERDSDNPEYSNKGHRAALSFNKKFADDTFGVAVALATTESPNNHRNYGVWGYATNDDGQILPTGISSHVISTELKRDTISAVFQYRPTDKLDIVLDVLNIDYSDSGIRRGIIDPFSAVNVVGTGANSTGTQINANPVLRTDPRQKTGELNTLGLNLEYFVTDNWSVELDAATSKSDKRDLRGESYAGLGRSGTVDPSQFGTRQFQMSPDGIVFSDSSGLDAFSDPTLLQLAGPQAWGGGMASLSDQFETDALQVNGNPLSYLDAQDGFLNYADFTEELTTVKFEVVGNLSGDIFTKVTAGVNYSDRFKDKVNKGFFATSDTYPSSESIPSDYVYGLADLTWMGLGEVVAYDGFAPYEDGTYTQNDAGFLEPDRLGDTYEVNEEVITLYVKTNFEYAFNDMFLVGNVGVQYVDTQQSSTGTIGVVGSNFKVCDDNDDGVVDESCQVDLGTDYSHVLPSLNLSLEFADSQFIKLAANKTISRARIDQMKASGFVKFTQNIDQISIPNSAEAVENYGSPWSKFTGNPLLRPLESNNFDLSYENYFSDEGYFAVAYFYKDLVNWTRDGDQTIDFTNDETNNGANYFVPGYHDRVIENDGTYGPAGVFYSQGDVVTPPDLGTYSFFEDGLEGTVEGIELTANVPLNVVADVLDGFGVAASYTYVDAELEDGSRVPGQSDKSYSITMYYQYEGFEFRVATTDRTGFLTYERGGSNKISEATRSAVTLVDAQISYDFADAGIDSLEGLRVSISGTNLTDEDEETIDDATGVVSSRRQFGPSYLFNVNYSF